MKESKVYLHLCHHHLTLMHQNYFPSLNCVCRSPKGVSEQVSEWKAFSEGDSALTSEEDTRPP